MNDDKMWALICFYSIWGGKPHWVMSDRKLSEDEINALYQRSQYSFDFNDLGVGYGMDGSVICEVVRTNVSKQDCQKKLIELNNGKDPLSYLTEVIPMQK